MRDNGPGWIGYLEKSRGAANLFVVAHGRFRGLYTHIAYIVAPLIHSLQYMDVLNIQPLSLNCGDVVIIFDRTHAENSDSSPKRRVLEGDARGVE